MRIVIQMKVLHILSAFRQCDGGPPRSVGGICSALAELKSIEPHLLFVENNKSERAEISVKVLLHPTSGVFGRGLNRFNGHGFGDKILQLHGDLNLDIIHTHGVWLKSNHEVCRACRTINMPLVLSPRGMLEPWALNNRYWKKKLALWLYAKKDLRSVTAFHATAESEAESIRRLGLKQPIAVIPNGVALPDISKMGYGRWDMEGASLSENQEPRSKNQEQTKKTALFLSRINPKKGLPMLLDAWKKVATEDWRLVIAGNDDSDHLSLVHKRICDLELRDHVQIVGPLFGKEKQEAYLNADLFVLPSYSENFGIVVTEALGYGVPVLTTTACPWRELETHNCGWWVEATPHGVERGLDEALRTKDEELSAMGQRGRRLVEDKYQWPELAANMAEFYKWILHGGQKPSFVV